MLAYFKIQFRVSPFLATFVEGKVVATNDERCLVVINNWMLVERVHLLFWMGFVWEVNNLDKLTMERVFIEPHLCGAML